MLRSVSLSFALVIGSAGCLGAQPTSPQPTLRSRFAADVDPANVLPEYPRPTMVRSEWLNLNGLWEYAIRPLEAEMPEKFDGSILVPFPVESQLSQVGRTVGADSRLWYRRTFEVPAAWRSQRTLLHFGAVDWRCEVLIDGKKVGEHQGGYDPFTFDISDALAESSDDEAESLRRYELVVAVFDPTDAGPQPRGKQVARPGGIWYTPVTGIWQTVWIEPVPQASIAGIRIDSSRQDRTATFTATIRGDVDASDLTLHVSVDEGPPAVAGAANGAVSLEFDQVRPWSPADPHLYDVTVELRDGDQVLDSVQSYFGIRSIDVAADENGIPRIRLNGEPIFLFGPLDQGWWPDGLYTAPTDEALQYDLLVTQQAGFNLVRKHVKVEPERWYAHCDRMGLIVWQDMPNGDTNARWPWDGTELERTDESRQIFEQELQAMVEARRHHPCIVAWVPFNEAWGQFDTVGQTERLRLLDPTRLIISASGGNDFGVGDVHDIHNYPGPEAPPAERLRAAVLGEYGGLGLPLAGHTWQDEANWGYRSFTSTEELQRNYLEFIDQLRPMIESRLAAAIYTQTTDVEVEVNGLMTYDREVLKLDPTVLAAAHRKLYEPLRELTKVERSFASTIAYWRFEAGSAGEPLPHDRDERKGFAARDDSEHDNPLYAWSVDNAPLHADDVAATVIPLTGADNRGSLDDRRAGSGATRDLYTDPGRSETHMNMLDTFVFTEFTIELSVKRSSDSTAGTLLGEDGRPVEGLDAAPLQIGLNADGHLTVAVIDAAGSLREIATREPLPLDHWSHVAVRSDGRELRLDRIEAGTVREESRSECLGGLMPHPGTWTVGRGFHAGQLGRDGRALLDEIRISVISLDDELLLWWER